MLSQDLISRLDRFINGLTRTSSNWMRAFPAMSSRPGCNCEASDALDITKESAATKEMYGIGESRLTPMGAGA